MKKIKKNTRNYYIELMRFLFTIMVVVAHFNTHYDDNVLRGRWNGHIAVEFFFVVSGYLMASYSAKREGNEPVWRETWVFIKKKFLGIASVYYVVFLIVVIIKIIDGNIGINKLRTFIPSLLSPAFLLPGIGFGESASIPFSWYIGSMLLAMFIIFPFLYKFGKVFTRIIAPIITVFFVAFAMQTYGKLFLLQQDWYGICFPQLFRALGEICLGCSAYEMSEYLKKRFKNRLTKAGKCLMTLASIGLLILPIVWIINGLSGNSHPCVLFMFALGCAITFSDLDFTYKLGEWKFTSTLFGWLGQISLGVYLGQGLLMNYLFPQELAGEMCGVYLYVGACLITGIILFYAAKLFALFCRLVKKQITKMCIIKSIE